MRGLVIPADPTQPTSVTEWQRDGELLPLLYGAIGCDTVDALTVPLDGADLALWVDDNGRRPGAVVNERCRALLDGLGWPALIFGTVVITEGADADGNTEGLRDELLADLQAAVAEDET